MSFREQRGKLNSDILSSNWVALLCIIIASFGVLVPMLLLKHTFFVNLDNVDQFYAWYQRLAIDIQHGFLPLWNANTFGGQSFVGDMQAGVFYPLNILWTWLFGSGYGISEFSLNMLMVLHFAIGAFGAYLLLKQMGISRYSSFFGGLLYVFSGSVAMRSISQTVIFIGLCLIPYPLYFLLRYHHKKQLRYLVYAGLVYGLIFLSGHIDSIYFAGLSLLVLELSQFIGALVKGRTVIRQLLFPIKNLVAVLIIGMTIGLPQILVSAQYLPHAYRWQYNGYTPVNQKISYNDFAATFNMNPGDLGNILNPDAAIIKDGVSLFFGLVPLALIIFAIRTLKEHEVWRRNRTFICLMFVIGVTIMLGYWTWLAVVLYKLPLVYQIREPVRYAILVQLAFVAIFAISLDAFINNRSRLSTKKRVALTSLSLFLLINAIYVYMLRKTKFAFSTHYALQLILLSLFLLTVVYIRRQVPQRAAIATLVIATLVVNSLWFLPKKTPQTYSIARYDLPASLTQMLGKTNGKYRVDIEDAALPVNTAELYNFQTVGGYGATVYGPYYQAQHSSPYVTHLLQAVHPASGANSQIISHNLLSDMLGIKYVVITQPKDPAIGETVYANDKQHIYVAERTTMLSKIFTTDIPGSLRRADYRSLQITTISYDDHIQSYRVTSPKTEMVIISEMRYPGWKLRIDGQQTQWSPYTISNIPLLRSFILPKGTHTVEFSYNPL